MDTDDEFDSDVPVLDLEYLYNIDVRGLTRLAQTNQVSLYGNNVEAVCYFAPFNNQTNLLAQTEL